MNCTTHPEAPAIAYCRTCGKALCEACRREWRGVIYCSQCSGVQEAVSPPPRPQPAVPAANPHSPGLAFALGLIPGVGAIYNGQYGKGIIHVIVFGLLVSILSSDSVHSLEALFGMLLAAWIFYMAFEAYHTAKKRRAGELVEEFSGLLSAGRHPGRGPIGPVILILLGVVFLLDTLDVLPMERIMRFWPMLLIAAGVYMLYCRLTGYSVESAPPPGPPGATSAPTGGAGEDLR